MTDHGTIGEIKHYGYSFSWCIQDFHYLPSETEGDFYWSPEIQHLDNVWKLRIYPKGAHSIPGYVMLQVWRTNVIGAKPVRFSLGIRDLEGTEKHFIRNERFDSDTSVCSGLFNFMDGGTLLEVWRKFCSRTELDISFTIWIDEPTSMEERKPDPAESKRKEPTEVGAVEEDRAHYDPKDEDSTFRQHLENMLLSGDNHDVTITVKDKQFRAHKDMLRARSPVFAAMFEHKMKESTDDSISIEDCDPESFGDFLRYVYTGRVKNLLLSNAMGLYYAGDKYDISHLKKVCVEFLKTSLSTTVIGDVISLAVRHGEGELLECAETFFSNNLVEIMSSVEWQRFSVDNPVQANEICLKAVKCRLD